MDESTMTDEQLLAQRCKLCHSKVMDCGCVMGKSPAIHAALECWRQRVVIGLEEQ